MYGTILVALENSRTDEVILAHVEALARVHGSSLLLVHVADGWAARTGDELNLAESPEIRADRAYLDSVLARFSSAGISAEPVLLVGEPGDELARLAEERDVDLIAMATHGHRFLSDLVLGSTASKVRHTVDIPVLLLKAPRAGLLPL